jgi:hypothetical protein
VLVALDQLAAALAACRANVYEEAELHIRAAIAMLRTATKGDRPLDSFGRVMNLELFRAVNELLGELETWNGRPGSTKLPFWCECDTPGCSTHVPLSLSEFDQTVGESASVLAPGHRLDRRSMAARQRERALMSDSE